MFEHLVLPEFLSSNALAQILRDVRVAGDAPAPVYGVSAAGSVDPRVRRARQLAASAASRQQMSALLREAQDPIGSHFGVALTTFEDPQFLRYVEGDFFVAHQDGNTPLVRDDTMHRRISVVVFLNDGYEGGALTFHGKYPDWQARFVVPAAPGSLVAFRSETTHEVTPVTNGERYTCVTWYR